VGPRGGEPGGAEIWQSHKELWPVGAQVVWSPAGLGLAVPWEAGVWHGLRGGELAVSCGAEAWQDLRGREPGRLEHLLQGLMGWGLGRPAVLLVDHGVEKPSTLNIGVQSAKVSALPVPLP
jgi:hypothetical protein